MFRRIQRSFSSTIARIADIYVGIQVIQVKPEMRLSVYTKNDNDWKIVSKLLENIDNGMCISSNEISFPFHKLDEITNTITDFGVKKNKYIIIDKPPNFVIDNITKYSKDLKSVNDDYSYIWNNIPNRLQTILYPFQRKSIEYIISHNGKGLIADDMGLGKTLQAITIAIYYKDKWPILIISPSSMKYTWKYEFALHAGGYVSKDDIHVVNEGKDNIFNDLLHSRNHKKIIIIPYSLVHKFGKIIRSIQFKFIICDESHYIKNIDALRTKTLVPILIACEHVVLLSGTPVLSRPMELYTQIKVINDSVVHKTAHNYGMRYCDGKRGKYGWEYKGYNNLAELNIILNMFIMIRHKKEDVLHMLPDKIRTLIFTDVNNTEINEIMNDIPNLYQLIQKMIRNDKTLTDTRLNTLYQLSGMEKVSTTIEYVKELIDAGNKVLIFAHHKQVMNALEKEIKKMKYNNKMIKYFRLDGETPSQTRTQYVSEFQNDSDYRIGLLSITAGSVGITLTEANYVVFCELYWTPSILKQAEDRIHRIGQTKKVFCAYIIANGTIDEHMWPVIQMKLNVTGTVLDGKPEMFDLYSD